MVHATPTEYCTAVTEPEVIEFGLENTFITCKDRSGGLRRQVKGIPMGDPNSPGMCIGACAWMDGMDERIRHGDEEEIPSD